MSRFVPDRPMNPQEVPVPQAEPPPEDELDALLQKVEEKKEKKGQEQIEEQLDAVDVFRVRLRQVYQPVFEELQTKYKSKGISLELDVDDLLGGGSGMKMKFIYGDLSMVLDGTVTRSGVAFYMIRASGGSQGTVLSGPMLRIRNLSADDFRHFVIEHLSGLIKDVLRQA